MFAIPVLKSWNVTVTSEGKQRELVHELTDGVSGECVLFSFPDRHKGHIMKPAPCVWVNDLEKKIIDMLDYNERSAIPCSSLSAHVYSYI